MLGPLCVCVLCGQWNVYLTSGEFFPITKPKPKQTKEPCPDFLDRKFGRSGPAGEF